MVCVKQCGERSLKDHFIHACTEAGMAFAGMRLLALAELKVIPNGQAGCRLVQGVKVQSGGTAL